MPESRDAENADTPDVLETGDVTEGVSVDEPSAAAAAPSLPFTGDRDLYVSLARTALLEITRDDTVGEALEIVDEGDNVATVRFSTTLPGYPGWLWTVSIVAVEGAEPTVLETELLPGGSALLAPDWVPWVERLADYEAAQEAAGEASDDDDSDDDESGDDDEADDDDLDDEDSDDDDFDEADDDGLDSDEGDDAFDGIDVETAAGLDESGRS